MIVLNTAYIILPKHCV